MSMQTLFVKAPDIEVGDRIVSARHTTIGTVSAVLPEYGLANSVHIEGPGFKLDLHPASVQCVLREMPETVTRYVVTCIDKKGMRTLAQDMDGRHTYATAEEAQRVLDNIIKNNRPDVVQDFYKDAEVRPCECWPSHLGPVGCWFD